MKKILSILAVVAITTTLSASAAETKVGSFLDKLNQKEQELNQKIDASQKARAEQRAAAEKKQAELKKQQEANQKALEQAKKDAQARQDARKKAVEAEKNYWKGVLNK